MTVEYVTVIDPDGYPHPARCVECGQPIVKAPQWVHNYDGDGSGWFPFHPQYRRGNQWHSSCPKV